MGDEEFVADRVASRNGGMLGRGAVTGEGWLSQENNMCEPREL